MPRYVMGLFVVGLAMAIPWFVVGMVSVIPRSAVKLVSVIQWLILLWK